jgi:hypothetical protein
MSLHESDTSHEVQNRNMKVNSASMRMAEKYDVCTNYIITAMTTAIVAPPTAVAATITTATSKYS